ncbi:MAG: MBL fold metallo-hydrolase, partial [Actinomycetota bacterium]
EIEDEFAAVLDPDEVPEIEESADTDFVPDEVVRTGDEVFAFRKLSVRALHTPGHTSNHTCFAMTDGESRILLSGDHVMGWSTTVVSPPDGDMGDYIEALRMVAGRDDHVAIPTHGPPIEHAGGYISELVEHRLTREAQVLAALDRGVDTIPSMVAEMYAAVHVRLHRAAALRVLGHLVKLVADGAVESSAGHATLDATYARI